MVFAPLNNFFETNKRLFDNLDSQYSLRLNKLHTFADNGIENLKLFIERNSIIV